MLTYSFISLFNINTLTLIISLLVGFISLIVGLYARRYLAGDNGYRRFYGLLVTLALSTTIMAAADHILLFLLSWAISNACLVLLITHKPQWQAAANAGWLTAHTFLLGIVSLSSALLLLYLGTGQTSIKLITTIIAPNQLISMAASACIILTAMTQSAIWPFHRWLISSANSPTPVSAIMHAGLVNGGGILLTKFAPLYYSQSWVLLLLFVIGISTAVIASVWKLMQSDIKRMLACSTMAQMGFMFAQCGLGLFPAAVAHFCWHGLFKANLFLQANSLRQEKSADSKHRITFVELTLALLMGAVGSYAFAYASQQPWVAHDTRIFLMLMVFITASQFSLILLEHPTSKKMLIGTLLITLICMSYGFSILIVEKLLHPMNLMQPQSLNLLHLILMIVLVTAWVLITFKHRIKTHENPSAFSSKWYVRALNASQPHPDTITTYRHQYKYL